LPRFGYRAPLGSAVLIRYDTRHAGSNRTPISTSRHSARRTTAVHSGFASTSMPSRPSSSKSPITRNTDDRPGVKDYLPSECGRIGLPPAVQRNPRAVRGSLLTSRNYSMRTQFLALLLGTFPRLMGWYRPRRGGGDLVVICNTSVSLKADGSSRCLFRRQGLRRAGQAAAGGQTVPRKTHSSRK